ncbi:Arc family DNA-binding protein [Nitratireductor sp. GISD-1A_MAKvit]|uniref:Arc family DNA-binding protein n=1 Tax=Nitratireductor sp. GISD-1A_MAKvit TaxID=3234198 RepID=UPI0034675F89
MARPKYPSDQLAQFMVRMPEEMREALKRAAGENARSMNAEIVARLEDSLAGQDQLSKLQLQLHYAQLRERELHAELAKAKSKASDRTLGEIPRSLRKRIEIAAHENERTLMEEVNAALLAAYPPPKFRLGDLVDMFEQMHGTDPERLEPGSSRRRIVEKLLETRQKFETGELSPDDEVSVAPGHSEENEEKPE